MSKKIYSDEYIKINHDREENEYIKSEHDIPDGLVSKDKSYTHEERDTFNPNEYNKKVTGASQTRYFCVFRVGKKIKNLNQVEMFEKHMEREMNVFNADPNHRDKNRILIGDKNVYENVKKYIYGIKIRSNANLGVDLVLSAGNGFYYNLPKEEQEIWIQENIKFLKENFGDNCVYAVIHMDETTPHIHALIVPKFWNEEKKRYELRSNLYFDGTEKMRNWQDKYAHYMNKKFNNLMRGIRGSKAKHMDIKTYYNLINKKLDIMDGNQIQAYAKRNFLLEKRLKTLEYTLTRMNENGDTEKLLKKVNKLEKNNKVYKDTIKAISKKYGIKEKEILELVDKVQSKEKNSNNEREK